MRLLDRLAQAQLPVVLQRPGGRRYRLWSAVDLAGAVAGCPQRYVMSDELAAACAELAFCTGDSLANCLDLIHIPGEQVWIEWSDFAAGQPAAAILGAPLPAEMARVGMYVRSSADGRTAQFATVWQDANSGEAVLAPLGGVLDLGRELSSGLHQEPDPLGGGAIRVTDADPSLNGLLECARFRMEASWAEYYRDACGEDLATR